DRPPVGAERPDTDARSASGEARRQDGNAQRQAGSARLTDGDARAPDGPATASAAEPPVPHGGWCALPGGTFLMGCDDSPYPADGEGPVRRVRVGPLQLAATAVTAAEFAEFAESTGYRTDAERFGWS